MTTIKLSTPLGLVEIEHANKSISATGSEIAMAWWKNRVSEGLYGPHGHIFHPDDCDACDVYHAALEAVGSENVEAPQSFITLSTIQTNLIPDGATP
jgi:hypothetical protein